MTSKKPTHATTTFGRYINDIAEHHLLSIEEEVSLSLAAHAGDVGARERMIVCNLRLVISIAKQYQRRDMALDDLVAEGNFGLMHAIDKYDSSLGYRFSTYAVWWIRQYIERGIMNQARTIRLPVHQAKRLNACLRAKRELEQRRNREPSTEEIAQQVARPVHEVRELMPWCEHPKSLTNMDGDDHWHEDLLDPNSKNPYTIQAGHEVLELLGRFLCRLNAREEQIICLRFGMKGCNAHTLDRIAKIIGITRERVRQIQVVAIKKLRQWMAAEQIESSFLDGD